MLRQTPAFAGPTKAFRVPKAERAEVSMPQKVWSSVNEIEQFEADQKPATVMSQFEAE